MAHIASETGAVKRSFKIIADSIIANFGIVTFVNILLTVGARKACRDKNEHKKMFTF